MVGCSVCAATDGLWGHWHNEDFFCSLGCCDVYHDDMFPSPTKLPVEEGQQEREKLIEVFQAMLWAVTGDGGRKRAAGLKPPWWRDGSHEAAIFSHLNKWKHGEKIDPDSGQHPLVHMAWRALAIAYQETVGKVDPLVGG